MSTQTTRTMDRESQPIPVSRGPLLPTDGTATDVSAVLGPVLGVKHRHRIGQVDVLSSTRMIFVSFAVLTFLAASTLLLLTGHTDRYFAWTITAEPTAAFYGAAYAAGFVLSVLGLREERWDRVRVALVTVATFTVLTLIPTLLHLHLFHLMAADSGARFAAWFWLAVYLAVPVACLLAIGQQRAASSVAEPVRRPMPRWLTAILAGQGVILVLVGAVLYVKGATVHHFPASALSFWPWPLGPLGAQVVGAWLIALGIATGLVIRERDLDRLFVPAATYAAFGGFQLLVAVQHWSEARPDNQWMWAYVTVLALMTVTGAYGCWKAHPASR